MLQIFVRPSDVTEYRLIATFETIRQVNEYISNYVTYVFGTLFVAIIRDGSILVLDSITR